MGHIYNRICRTPPACSLGFARRLIARGANVDRCVDCGGVLLAVDSRCFPSAATSAAETPASATTGGVGQFPGAPWAGTFADGDTSESSRARQHAFPDRT